jgi:hypothetical protein
MRFWTPVFDEVARGPMDSAAHKNETLIERVAFPNDYMQFENHPYELNHPFAA